MQIEPSAVPPNILAFPVAVEDSQAAEQRVWLKAVAPKNMSCMVVTADTSHAERSWLKALAPANTPYMLVTAETFHAEISWLKAGAFPYWA